MIRACPSMREREALSTRQWMCARYTWRRDNAKGIPCRSIRVTIDREKGPSCRAERPLTSSWSSPAPRARPVTSVCRRANSRPVRYFVFFLLPVFTRLPHSPLKRGYRVEPINCSREERRRGRQTFLQCSRCAVRAFAGPAQRLESFTRINYYSAMPWQNRENAKSPWRTIRRT